MSHPASTRTARRLLLPVMGAVVLLFAAWTEATRPVLGPHGRLEMGLLRSDDSLAVYVGSRMGWWTVY